MKINFKSKKTLTIIGIAVVLVPILYNQGKSLVTGLITQYMASQPKTVQIAKPIEREIYPTFKTAGRIEAKYSVNIIARVNGWLQKRYFEEGDVVKKGQKLFLIEPDEYVLAAKNANATVRENTAVYKNSQIDLTRAEQLLKEDLVSREYYDNMLTERNKNRAALDGSIAQLSQARLNLSYTNITAPMNGRIGKVLITEGNYVTPSTGVLAEIYTTNPMRVVFSAKSEDFIMLKKHYKEVQAAKLKDEKSDNQTTTKKELPISVALELADGSVYDREGTIEFIDNKIDEATGTVSMRAVFENPDEILLQGDYVNVILKLNKPQKVMLIPQSATKTDVGTGYYVWVAKDGKAVKKDVVVQDNIDNYWVVESGLSYDDDVIVTGIQNIYKTGQKIKTEQYIPETTNKTESKVK